MRNKSFNLLCIILSPHISKEDTRFSKCIPAEIKLAAILYYLNGASNYKTSQTVWARQIDSVLILHTVSKQIVRSLLETYINLPKEVRQEKSS